MKDINRNLFSRISNRVYALIVQPIKEREFKSSHKNGGG